MNALIYEAIDHTRKGKKSTFFIWTHENADLLVPEDQAARAQARKIEDARIIARAFVGPEGTITEELA